MKFFAYILSIIVLVLSVNPCIDEPADDVLQKNELTQSTNNNNHQNDTNHCSPFCVCQCCQTNFYVSNITFLAPSNELGISFNEYSPSFQSLELFDFYIPPKS